MQILLKPESMDMDVKQDIPTGHSSVPVLARLDPELNVVNQVLAANRTALSLNRHREKTGEENAPWSLVDGLLLFYIKAD